MQALHLLLKKFSNPVIFKDKKWKTIKPDGLVYRSKKEENSQIKLIDSICVNLFHWARIFNVLNVHICSYIWSSWVDLQICRFSMQVFIRRMSEWIIFCSFG